MRLLRVFPGLLMFMIEKFGKDLAPHQVEYCKLKRYISAGARRVVPHGCPYRGSDEKDFHIPIHLPVIHQLRDVIPGERATANIRTTAYFRAGANL